MQYEEQEEDKIKHGRSEVHEVKRGGSEGKSDDMLLR
jgi:hypothetical protein